MNAFLLKLKTNKLKCTPKRIAILKLFMDKKRFLSPKEIFDAIKKKFKRASFPAVYRNLEELNKAGVLLKVQRPDRRLYYAVCGAMKDYHHHHIICVKCGKVGEVSECFLPKKKKIAGFTVLDHFLQLEGLCNECS